MSAPSYIRRHIENLVDNKPFSIRDFLIYGSRNTVDQVFRRLVISGRILRVARGVYIKSFAPLPSVMEVVQVKAKAFGRTIAIHGSEAHRRLINRDKTRQYVFTSSGATSSFRVGKHVIRLIHGCPRKLALQDTLVGLAIRALWYLGKQACEINVAAQTTLEFQKSDRRMLRLSAAFMPAWLRSTFSRFGRMDCLARDISSPARAS